MPFEPADAGVFKLEFAIEGMDMAEAGDVASAIKRALQQLGLEPSIIRRAAVAAYEAETNIAIHAYRGKITVIVDTHGVSIDAQDEGPGIADINLAMTDGYSTAPQHIREMGFGAGMGLPNIKRCSDEMHISSEVGVGTHLTAFIKFQQ